MSRDLSALQAAEAEFEAAYQAWMLQLEVVRASQARVRALRAEARAAEEREKQVMLRSARKWLGREVREVS